MPGSIRSGVVVVLAWMAISVCVTELMERRAAVVAFVEDVPLSLVSGAMSYVYEGIVDSDD
jgi:hypothetical protein